MNLTKRQAELAETRLAAALGRPLKQCPMCGAVPGDHYIPEALDDAGMPVPGYWVCAPVVAPERTEGLF
jgi:hypothetical protein